MATELLEGTPAGALLDSRLDELLQLWNNRAGNEAMKNWVGFGVSLDVENPRIVHFIAGGAAPDPSAYSLRNLYLDNVDIDLNLEDVPIFRTYSVFQTIPPGEGPPGKLNGNAQPGDFISASVPRTVTNNGTLGVFLVETGNPGARWALSANHVIGFNSQFPNRVSVDVTDTNLRVGQPRCVTCVQNTANPADVAVVPCANPAAASAVIPGLPISNPSTVGPHAGIQVLKVGWATPMPVPGNVSYFAARISVTQDPPQTMGFSPCEFSNQWMIEGPSGPHGFAAPGDSGAIVVASLVAGNAPFGILIAVQQPVLPPPPTVLSVVTPFQNVLDSLKDATGITFELDPATVGAIAAANLK